MKKITKKSLILGIDIGGTKIATGLVDFRGKVTQFYQEPTQKKAILTQLNGIIGRYPHFSAIGIGFPGRVLPSGRVVHMANIPNFKSTNIKAMLEEKFKVPVTVDNDAKNFALAEATIGAGKHSNSVAGVTLGTGIGVGIVIGRKVYYGKNFLAGELGHTLMLDGKSFEQHVKQAGRFRNARQAQKYLLTLLSMIVRSFDPDVIVFGGGWSKLAGMETVLKGLLKNIHKTPVKTKVKVSRLSHAGIIGAALLAKKK
jgi:glucokinase